MTVGSMRSKKTGAELPEIGPGSKATRHDLDELARPTQQRRTHSHEQRVDVRLAMHDAGNRQSARIVATNLEVRRIGNDGIEVRGWRARGKQLTNRLQCSSVGNHEVFAFDSRCQKDAPTAAPLRQVFEYRGQRAAQFGVALVRYQFYAARRTATTDQSLYCGATQHACSRRWVEQPHRSAASLNERGHEVRHRYRRQIEAMHLPVLARSRRDVPSANAVGEQAGPFLHSRRRG